MAFLSTPATPQIRLWLLTAVLFLSYLCVAIALPIVPLFVADRLGLNSAWAGLAVGISFLSTVLTRGYAGSLSDRIGPKVSVVRGLTCYAFGAAICMLPALMPASPMTGYGILLAGRLLVGLGESLVVVGVIAWGISIVGPSRSGRALSLLGAALYGALAVGAPIGVFLADRSGFVGAMAASSVLPVLGLLAIWPMTKVVPVRAGDRPSYLRVIRQIWAHGLIVALQGIGFAAIGAFFVLSFHDQGWANAALGLTAFGGGFVLVRALLGHLPDRFGGLPVAIGSLAVETVGQVLIWLAPGPEFALAGAFLTGLGCSLVFPAMGREVVHIVAPHLRATALGGYSAFQDLAYGLTGPLAGLLALRAGYDSVFLVGALAAGLGVLIGLSLLLRPSGPVKANEPA